MKEHLTLVSDLPAIQSPSAIESSQIILFESRSRSGTHLSQSLDYLDESLKSMLKHTQDDDKMEYFAKKHRTYNNDYLAYMSASEEYLVETYGSDRFIANLPSFIETLNNERIERYNKVLEHFEIRSTEKKKSEDDKSLIFVEYTKEEIIHDLGLPRLVSKDDPHGPHEVLQKGKEVVNQQLDCEFAWLVSKRSEVIYKPSRVEKVASYITSLFV